MDGNTKTPIGEIDNFPFEINGIQILTKVFVIEATQYQALVSWVDIYQTELLPPPTWEEKRKDRAEKKLQSILYLITKLPEPEEKEELLTKDILFQEPNQTTEIEQYLAYPDLFKELELKWYSNDNKEICPEKAHKTNTSFDLRYSEQLPIVIALHFLVKIDLKIVLEIFVSTIIQVVSRLNLAKKKINVKEGIINAGYMKNIIVMLQNNSNKLYKIESHKKIAQAILSLVKIPQLVLVTT
ncbi:hypothetical protein G9A89_005253 [Geosiphon pyriformis]|nr:hypothetical protein G9A89_005253 [Geosiphon pyriformis]